MDPISLGSQRTPPCKTLSANHFQSPYYRLIESLSPTPTTAPPHPRPLPPITGIFPRNPQATDAQTATAMECQKAIADKWVTCSVRCVVSKGTEAARFIVALPMPVVPWGSRLDILSPAKSGSAEGLPLTHGCLRSDSKPVSAKSGMDGIRREWVYSRFFNLMLS